MAVAHEQGDAIVGTRQHKLRSARAQTLGTTAAEGVAKKDGIVAERVGGIDALLQMRTHAGSEIVQAHGERFKVDRVRGAGDNVFHLASEDLAKDRFQAHEYSFQLSAVSFQQICADVNGRVGGKDT
jgi:hypothetical protein